ncbi:MAG TPA: hypothetical protein VGE41_13280 [Verrucomicrobiae bacterium]
MKIIMTLAVTVLGLSTMALMADPTVNVSTLDGSISCEEAKKRFTSDEYESPEEGQILMMRITRCKTESWNNKHPEDPKVVVVSPDENGRILFNTLHIGTAEKIRDAAKVVVDAALIGETGASDPLSMAVVTAAGNYTVDSYFEAAKKNNPLIIIFPAAVPGQKMTADALKALHLKNPQDFVVKSGQHVLREGKIVAQKPVKPWRMRGRLQRMLERLW